MSQKSLPPLNWLRAFEASARALSFTGAAAELGLTQSAISQQIKSLEAYLGRALFHRRARRLELTEAGRNYLPVVQEAFATLATGTRSLLGVDRGRVLHVRANLSFSVHVLGPRLGELFARFPWMRINISSAIWEPEPHEGPADVEIRFGMQPRDDARAERLNHDMFYPVARPGLLRRVEDLTDQALFDCSGMTCTWEAWMRGQGRSLPEGKTVTYASTYAVALAAAEAGAGAALIHDTLAATVLTGGRLEAPPWHREPMREAYWLIEPEPASATPASRTFAGWLREVMARGRSPEGAVPA